MTLATPFILEKRSCGPQNHPLAKIAMELVEFVIGLFGMAGQSIDILFPMGLWSLISELILSLVVVGRIFYFYDLLDLHEHRRDFCYVLFVLLSVVLSWRFSFFQSFEIQIMFAVNFETVVFSFPEEDSFQPYQDMSWQVRFFSSLRNDGTLNLERKDSQDNRSSFVVVVTKGERTKDPPSDYNNIVFNKPLTCLLPVPLYLWRPVVSSTRRREYLLKLLKIGSNTATLDDILQRVKAEVGNVLY